MTARHTCGHKSNRMSKTELEELGETVDDLANGFSKYAAEIKALTGFSILVDGTTDSFKDLYDIMDGIAAVWDKLSDTQQARVAEILGGTRQLQVISSIIGNWGDAVDAYSTALGSANVAANANAKYMETAAAHINQFKASLQELSRTLISSKLVSSAVSVGTGLLNIINYLAKIRALLPTVITLYAAYATVRKTIAVNSIIKQYAAEGGATTALTAKVANLTLAERQLLTTRIENLAIAGTMSAEQKEEMLSQLGLVGSTNALAGANKGLALSFKEVMASVPVWGWIALAISALISIVGGVNSAIDKHNQKIEEAANKAASLSDDITSLTSSYINLSSQVGENAELKGQLLDVENDLIEKLGLERSTVRELAKEYGSYTDAIKAAALEKLKENELDLVAAQRLAEKNLRNTFYTDGAYNAALTGVATGSSARNFKGAWSQSIDEFKKMLAEIEQAGYRIFGNAVSEFGVDIEVWGQGALESAEDYVEFYNRIVKLQQIVLDNGGEEGLLYQRLDSIREELREHVESYTDSISELNANLAEQYMLDKLIGREVPETKSDFEDFRKELIDAAKDSGQFVGSVTDIEDAFDKLFSHDVSFARFYETAEATTEGIAQGAGKGAVEISDLSDALTQLKSNYDLLATAQEEAFNKGLTPSTIKSIKDAVAELTDGQGNYLDYLYEENGIVKLNTEAWKQLINSRMEGDIAALQSEKEQLAVEREDLQRRIAQIKANIEGLNNSGQTDDPRVRQALGEWNRLLAQYTAELETNTAAAEENQAKLELFLPLYQSISGTAPITDPYQAALDDYRNSITSLMDSVSSALKTVADLQKEVADGFTMSLDKAREFAAVYPEILDGATLTADGQLQLNEQTVNAFIDGKEAEQHAAIDAKIAELEADKSHHEAYVRLLQAQLEAAKSKDLETLNSANALVRALIENGVTEVDAYELGCEAMSGDTQELATHIMQACIDSDGNINRAAYNAAMGIINNSNAMRANLHKVGRAASQAAAAVAGIPHGRTTNIEVTDTGTGGGENYQAYLNSLGSGYSVNGTGFSGSSYVPDVQLHSLEQYIADLNVDLTQYMNAINQIDGQIALLRALRERGLGEFASDYGSSSGSGSGSGSSGSGSSGSGSNWFEQQYKLHQHLRKMDMESTEDYLHWLSAAYQQAYREGIISLDDFMRYQEEVHDLLRELFKDYLNDVEHEISMLQHFEGNEDQIIALYQDMLEAIEAEIEAARAQGLTDTDDYIQELQNKWKQPHHLCS